MSISLTDIPALLNKLTLDEKLDLLVGKAAFSTRDMPQHGIPSIYLADGHNGLNIFHLMEKLFPLILGKCAYGDSPQELIDQLISESGLFVHQQSDIVLSMLRGDVSNCDLSEYSEDVKAFIERFSDNISDLLPEGKLPLCFPTGMNMAMSWNPRLVRAMGEAVANESLAFGVDVMLGPNINIQRDPRFGRNFECYSEDPYVVSEIAKNYIEGVQSKGVLACVKHFCANNQETERRHTDVQIDTRTLNEIYFPGFKAATTQANVATLMTGYNSLNGKACSEQDMLMTEVLRKQWQWQGTIVSDWCAVYSQLESLQAGNDLEMPGPTDRAELKQAFDKGILSIETLDQRVSSVLSMVAKSPSNLKPTSRPERNISANQSLALELAQQSMVLLKNEAALPWDSSQSLAIIGNELSKAISTGHGSAGVVSPYVISAVQGICSVFPDAKAYPDFNSLSAESVKEVATQSDAAVVYASQLIGEGFDREDLLLSAKATQILERVLVTFKSVNKPVVLVLNTGGPIDLSPWIDGLDAVIFCGYPGQEMGSALASILSGEVNPSGRLTQTWPAQLCDTASYLNFPGESQRVHYGEGLYVGYRYADKKHIKPAFPFGHGLSYSKVSYSELKFSADSIHVDKPQVRVSLTLKNLSERDTQEVVQLYIQDIKSTLHRPVKELKGFRKLEVEAGKSVDAVFELDATSWHMFDPQKGWVIEPGQFNILVGASSGDIRSEASISITGQTPYPYDLQTAIIQLFENPATHQVIKKHIPEKLLLTPAVQMQLVYYPEMPLQKMLNENIAPSLGLSDLELEKLKEVLEHELKEIAPY